jgi:penicillin-binding protein 1A
VAEIVRTSLYKRYGEKVYSSGFKVYTTIHKQHQEAANAAVIQGIINFELRHGFRGAEKVISLQSGKMKASEARELLRDFVTYNQFVPALVTKVEPNLLTLVTQRGTVLKLQDKAILLVKNHMPPAKRSPLTLTSGSVIRV